MAKSKISQVRELLPSEIYSGDESVRNFEASLISQAVFSSSYTELVVDEKELIDTEISQVQDIVNQRMAGLPLAYILKTWSFRDLELFIDERVLVPRSETETVVERALDEIKNFGEVEVLDIGTGSGAIALSIATEHESSRVLGVDISEKALEVANINKNLCGLDSSRVTFKKSNLFSEVNDDKIGKFDLIISNPPYIGEDEISDLESSVYEHEPHVALFAGKKGFEIYERIIDEAPKWLSPRGILVLEIAPRHVEGILLKTKQIADISIEKDLSGRDRIALVSYRA